MTEKITIRRVHFEYLKEKIQEMEKKNARLLNRVVCLENKVQEQRHKLEVAYNAIKDF